MTTQIIPLENGEIILLPDWQLSHIGITRDETGKRKGHTDFENATGSVFSKEFLGPLNNEQDELRAINKLTASLIDVLTAPNTLRSGNLIQAELPRLVGYDALTKSDACSGVIIKSEYDPSLKTSRAVLVPGIVSTKENITQMATDTLSIIARSTTDAQFLPDDVKENPLVLKALEANALKTIVSMFPGKSIWALSNDGGEKTFKDVPPASQMPEEGFKFYTSPSNENFIRLTDSENANDICQLFNNYAHIPMSDRTAVQELVTALSGKIKTNELLGLPLTENLEHVYPYVETVASLEPKYH